MPGISPNFEDWRQYSALPIWKIAALMQGFDPRAASAGEVVVRCPSDPSSPYGMPPDLSWEIDVLYTAVQTNHLLSVPVTTSTPPGEIKVTKASLLPWLRSNGYAALAAELDTPSQICEFDSPPVNGQRVIPAPSVITTTQIHRNGTAILWTTERKLAAKEMLTKEKAAGVRDYAAKTAKAFNVSPARLRAVLSDKPTKKTAKVPSSTWHP